MTYDLNYGDKSMEKSRFKKITTELEEVNTFLKTWGMSVARYQDKFAIMRGSERISERLNLTQARHRVNQMFGEPDTSDIPEADEKWFKEARLAK